MNNRLIFPSTLVALAALASLAGCNTTPPGNALLDEAHTNYNLAMAAPQASTMAAPELKQASDALGKADEAWKRHDSVIEVDHLAYLAKQKVAIAQETTRVKTAEATVANASAARDKVRLIARTDEADAAKLTAQAAQQDAAMSQQQAAVSQQQATDAQERNKQLLAQLKDLNAKQTDRGLVVTIGDVLFDTDKAQLKSGGMRSIDKLAEVLKAYPQRKAMVEGFTDSTGSDGHNQELSGRRADAVRAALMGQGIAADRVSARGYGEAYPVLSDDTGRISAR
jgi:outer membrane protein OmpA-like peptidoglycan-associated protein